MKISKRFVDRAKGCLRRYQKILESARARDVNESDTVVIITDFLTDVLGYDKYSEITTEFSIRSTFCDLALKVGGDLRYLIEVKSAGTDLRDNHLKQAVDYAANQGVECVMLTNGVVWQIYRVRFEQPINHDLMLTIDLLDPSAKAAHLLAQLYLLSKEATSGNDMDEYWRRQEATSRYVVSQLLLSEPVLRLLRREIRQLSKGVSVSTDHLAELLKNEVIKRDALEGERAESAMKHVRRSLRRKKAKAEVEPVSATAAPSAEPAAASQATAATTVAASTS